MNVCMKMIFRVNRNGHVRDFDSRADAIANQNGVGGWDEAFLIPIQESEIITVNSGRDDRGAAKWRENNGAA